MHEIANSPVVGGNLCRGENFLLVARLSVQLAAGTGKPLRVHNTAFGLGQIKIAFALYAMYYIVHPIPNWLTNCEGVPSDQLLLYLELEVLVELIILGY